MNNKKNYILNSFFIVFYVIVCIVLYISCFYTTSVDGLPYYDGKIVSADKDSVLGGYSYTIQYNIDNQLVTKELKGVYNSSDVIGKDIKVYVKDNGKVITDFEIDLERNSDNIILWFIGLYVIIVFTALVVYLYVEKIKDFKRKESNLC